MLYQSVKNRFPGKTFKAWPRSHNRTFVMRGICVGTSLMHLGNEKKSQIERLEQDFRFGKWLFERLICLRWEIGIQQECCFYCHQSGNGFGNNEGAGWPSRLISTRSACQVLPMLEAFHDLFDDSAESDAYYRKGWDTQASTTHRGQCDLLRRFVWMNRAFLQGTDQPVFLLSPLGDALTSSG